MSDAPTWENNVVQGDDAPTWENNVVQGDDAPTWENNVVQEPQDGGNVVGALPEGQVNSGQTDVDIVVPERPSAKVDPKKILIFLMVITKGSENYVVVSISN